MTQTPTKKPETPWQVTFPKDDTQTDHSRRSLVAACYGHEGVARVLDRFVYLASWKVKNERLESCKDVQLSLTHKDILDSLQKSNNYNITRKTLIKYLDRLHEWKYVTCPRYGRTYIVHFEPVQAAIDQPPEPTPKARRPKCCKVVRKSEEDNATTLQLSSEITVQHYTDLLREREELAQKVVSLQQNVEQLQLKVVSLQQNVGNVTTLQRDLAALEKLVHDHFAETPVITYHLPSLTGKYIGDDAIAHHPLITLTSLLDQEEDEYEHLIVESTLKGITLPSTHIETPSGSYSQQHATRNAPVENDNDTHSHEEIDDHGLMDEPTAGNLDNSRPAAVPRSDRNALTQDACTDTRRTADTGSAGSRQHSRGSGRTLHADPPTEARQQDAAVGRANHEGAASGQGVTDDARSQQTGQAQTTTGRAAADVVGQAQAEGDGLSAAPIAHQGRAQTTPSLSVENSNPEGEGKKPGRGRRKPKVVDPDLMDRVNKVYDAFDKVAQEASGDPDFHYDRTKKTTKAISEWLPSKPTEKSLRETYMDMVNTPADPRTGFSWSENMTIEAVIRKHNLRRLSGGIKNKRLSDNHVVTASAPATATTTPLSKYWVEEEEDDGRPVILLSRLQDAMRKGTSHATLH